MVLDVLDSALLRMPSVGFIAGRDPMWTSTLAAMDGELVTDSLVSRYDPTRHPTACGRRVRVLAARSPNVGVLTRPGRLDYARLPLRRCSPTPTT